MKWMMGVRVIFKKGQEVTIPQQLWVAWAQGVSVEDIWYCVILAVGYYSWSWMNSVAIWDSQWGSKVPRTGAALACRGMLHPSAQPAKLRLCLLLICRICQPVLESTFPLWVGVLKHGGGFLQETASSDCIPQGSHRSRRSQGTLDFIAAAGTWPHKVCMYKQVSAKTGSRITPKVEVLHLSESALMHSVSSLSCVIAEDIT